MRKSLAIATFIVAGAGALGVGAASTLPNFNGSDTLGDVTHEMISTTNASGTTIPGTPFCTNLGGSPYTLADGGSYALATSPNLNYLGGGSGKGESQMVAAGQSVAPMSRPMGTAICPGVTGTTTGASNANGIVVALDGLSFVVGSYGDAGGAAACNGDNSTACTGEPTVGLNYDGGVTSAQRSAFSDAGVLPAYPFNSWQDILKVLYAGVIDTNFGHSTDPEVGRNCNSTVRQALAANWGDLFENPACGSGACKTIQHIFRRDDASGTSDIFAAILNLTPSPAYNKVAVAANLGGFFLGNDPFCNDMANQSVTNGSGALVTAAPGTWPGLNPAGLVANQTTAVGIIANDHQDYDPIRRACAGKGSDAFNGNPTEQVCELGTYNPALYSGNTVPNWGPATLGLLLPVVTTNSLSSLSSTQTQNANLNVQYDILNFGSNTATINRCTQVNTIIPPKIKNPSGGGVIAGLCPNGDLAGAAGICYVPVDNNNNPNCITYKADPVPPFAVTCTGVPSLSDGSACAASGLNPQAPASANGIDPRVFNLWAYVFNSTTSAWNVAVDDSGRPVTGAYYRIHTSQDMLAPNAGTQGGVTTARSPVCANVDATDEIGCLVQASPCSIGYAGRSAETALTQFAAAPGAQGLRLVGVPDAVACIQNFSYKYSRKLYLNTINGFQNASPAEQTLAACEGTQALIDQAVNLQGFVPIPSGSAVNPSTGVNNGVFNGNPFCEDINEKALCSASTTNDGCTATLGLGLVAQEGAFCGDGVIGPFEDCDNGTGVNGPPPAACSITCRNNF